MITALAWGVHLALYPIFALYQRAIQESMDGFDAWLAEQAVGAERLAARHDLALTA